MSVLLSFVLLFGQMLVQAGVGDRDQAFAKGSVRVR
jgi:hypothetical protein